MDISYKNIELCIEDNYGSMSKKAAEIIAGVIEQNPRAVIGFATGGTPIGAYKELIAMYKMGTVDFSGITTFNLDEYYPIKRDNEQSYYSFMHENLFKHINVNESNINILNGEAPDPIREIAEYEEKIIKSGGIDLQILGIGHNGHIAFNEPSDTFTKYTSLVNLTEDTIKANARFFEKEDDVPKQALSMGIRSIMMAKKIILIANGKGKVESLKSAVFGEITPHVPASVLQLHQNVVFVVDKEAYGE